jgi:hypothetical protein
MSSLPEVITFAETPTKRYNKTGPFKLTNEADGSQIDVYKYCSMDTMNKCDYFEFFSATGQVLLTDKTGKIVTGLDGRVITNGVVPKKKSFFGLFGGRKSKKTKKSRKSKKSKKVKKTRVRRRH